MVFVVPRVAEFSGQVLDVLHHSDLVVKNFDGCRHVDYDLVLGGVVLRAVDGLNQTKHLAHWIDGAEKKNKIFNRLSTLPPFFWRRVCRAQTKKFSLAKKTTHAYFFFSDNSEILPSALEAFNP